VTAYGHHPARLATLGDLTCRVVQLVQRFDRALLGLARDCFGSIEPPKGQMRGVSPALDVTRTFVPAGTPMPVIKDAAASLWLFDDHVATNPDIKYSNYLSDRLDEWWDRMYGEQASRGERQ
jgi:hypothetical protein